VVAGEVRSLAQRSAEAAREIKQLIDASVETVRPAAELVGDAGRTMDDIVTQVQRVNVADRRDQPCLVPSRAAASSEVGRAVVSSTQ
jgi:methyl-accepting chemotaxis protein